MSQRHEKYYFRDGNVIFLVDTYLFKIHYYLLERSESSIFRTLFTLPTPNDPQSEMEGTTDSHPIVLNDVLVVEFEALMRIFYPPLLDDTQLIPMDTLSLAMRISSKYCMEDVQTAIAEVVIRGGKPKTLDEAIGRLRLCAEFPSYFKDATISGLFVGICRWKDHPTAQQLGLLQGRMDLIAHIMSGRVFFFTRSPVGAKVKETWWEDKSGSLDEKKAEFIESVRKPPENA